jgi:hypothetical protein
MRMLLLVVAAACIYGCGQSSSPDSGPITQTGKSPVAGAPSPPAQPEQAKL